MKQNSNHYIPKSLQMKCVDNKEGFLLLFRSTGRTVETLFFSQQTQQVSWLMMSETHGI